MIVWEMWEPRLLTTLWVSMVCYRDSFTFTVLNPSDTKITGVIHSLGCVVFVCLEFSVLMVFGVSSDLKMGQYPPKNFTSDFETEQSASLIH
jgi:hypothetical protein